MEDEKIEQIFSKLNRMWAKLAKLGGSSTHEEAVEALLRTRNAFGTAFTDSVCVLTKQILGLPDSGPTVEGKLFHELLGAYGNTKDLRILLSTLSEDCGTKIDRVFDAVITAIPEIREGVLGIAKRLPTKTPGRPRLFDQQQQASICRDVGLLLAEGVSLQDAQKRIGLREGASSRTIK